MKLISIISFACLAYSTLAADDSTSLNEWGSYYKLEGTQLDDKQALFTLAFNSYLEGNPETSCKKDGASFSRWYESSKDSDKFILSYYCMTSGAYGYEHVKVSKSQKKVLEWQDKLSGFGIPDAGSYSDAGNLAGADAEAIQVEKLALVNETVEALVDDDQDPICLNPGTQTLYTVQRKTENGLDYYRFPISCDTEITSSDGDKVVNPHSHMTHIEVAQDNSAAEKKWNDGAVTLVVVEDPERNTEFIANKEDDIQSGKQGGSAALYASIFTVFLAPMLSFLA